MGITGFIFMTLTAAEKQGFMTARARGEGAVSMRVWWGAFSGPRARVVVRWAVVGAARGASAAFARPTLRA